MMAAEIVELLARDPADPGGANMLIEAMCTIDWGERGKGFTTVTGPRGTWLQKSVTH